MNLNWTVNDFGESYLFELHRDRFIAQRSSEQLDRYFKDGLNSSDQLSIIIGSESGLLIPFVERKLAASPNARCIILELDFVLEEIADKVSIESDRLILCTLQELGDALDTFGFKRYVFVEKVRVLYSQVAVDDYIECYQQLFQEVNSLVIQKRLMVQASTLGSRKFFEEQIINSPDYIYPASSLKPMLKDKDVVILAGGPSAESLSDWLVKHRGHYILIAVTRVAGFLESLGLLPDFYISVDPHQLSFNISRTALAQSEQVPLIAANHAHNLLVSNWCSQVFMLDGRLPWDSDLNVSSFMSAAPTVTHSAISFATEAGARKILLAGMDLCYGRGMKSHVAGTPEAQAGAAFTGPTYPVQTYSGRMAETNIRLLLSVEMAASLAQTALDTGVMIYNLSSEAAVVEGIDYCNSDDLELSPTPLSQVLPEAHLDDARHYLQALETELSGFDSALEQLQDSLQKRHELISTLFKSKQGVNHSVMRQVSELDSLLEQLGESRSRFLTMWGFGYFLKGLNRANADDLSQEEIIEYFETHYQHYLTVIREIRQTFDVTLKKINRRQRELDPTQLQGLESDWLAAVELRRINRLPSLFPELSDSKPFQKVRASLKAAYSAYSAGLDAEEEVRCQKMASPEALSRKALEFFRRRNVLGLVELEQILTADDKRRYPFALSYQVQGYLHELNDDRESAVQAYTAVINEGESIALTSVLKRILTISTEKRDYEQALQAIECLSLLDKIYLKHYAEFLLNLGAVSEALDKMADYHQAFPNDIDNLVRIVEVYLRVEKYEQALALSQELLTLHPENIAVKKVVEKVRATQPSH